MAIGAIWGEIWNEAIWDTSIWSQSAVEPQPELESTQKPAGRPKRPRRRMLVEIDGQDFEVSSAEEARVLLEQARKIATKAIQKARETPLRVSRGIPRPRITTEAPELRQVVAQARRDIGDLYDGLSRDMEIAALMRRREEDQEEEAILRFLM